MTLDRNVTNILSTCLDIYSCIIAICILISLFTSITKNKSTRYLIFCSLCLLIFNAADITNWTCEGTANPWNKPILHIFTFLYYFILPFMFTFYFKYVEEYLKPHVISKFFTRLNYVASFIYLIFTIITPFTGLFYYITPDNYYTRGSCNFVSTIFFAIYYIFTTGIIIANIKHFSKREYLSFLSFSFLPITCEIIQLKFYGLGLVNIGMTVSFLLIYMNIHKNLETSLKTSIEEVHDKDKKIANLQEHTILSLSNLVENRDTDTGEHAQRTSLYVEYLARKLLADGYYSNILDEQYIRNLVKAAPMHDIGKITISDTILKKAGRLNTIEYEQMKVHAKEGGRIVNDIIGISDDKDYIQIAVEMAESHHEKWDGTGYPNHLSGEKIPLSARIMAVADVFDALVSKRCYKMPISPDEAFDIIKNESGSHFDPVLVQEFLLIKEPILEVLKQHNN